MKAVFLSDVHLKDPDGAHYDRLLRFFDGLRGRSQAGPAGTPDGGPRGRAAGTPRPAEGRDGRNDAPPANPAAGPSPPPEGITLDRLVIAGDFFDFWFSKGETIYHGFREIVDRLAALKRQGVRIHLCEGNHDFFLDDYFSHRQGFDVHAEWAELDLDGLRVLAAHGDTVDAGNHRYLALRAFLRSPGTRRLEQILPRSVIWPLARFWSKMSRRMAREPQGRLVEVMHRFAEAKFRQGYDAVILGHCHDLLMKQTFLAGRERTFVTLGDWMTHGSYLIYEDGRFTLRHIPPGG
ncbi:MAG: UDP-2,3-diacylglucosamine diphosphatase [Thermodesulfobacteriota bacterium]